MKSILSLMMCVVGLYGCATPSQISADAEVRRLCAIDGGVKVYETVRLPAERFDQYGSVKIQPKSKATPADEYYYELDSHYYLNGNYEEIAMWRSSYRIFRRSDGKLLGESVRYIRRGGDVPGPWHPSSFSCPALERNPSSLESSIFVKGVTQ